MKAAASALQPAVPWRFHNKAGRASSAQRACSRKALPPRDHIELLPYRQIPFFGPSPKGNSDEPEEREVLSPCLINPCVCGTTFAKAAIPRHFVSLFRAENPKKALQRPLLDVGRPCCAAEADRRPQEA